MTREVLVTGMGFCLPGRVFAPADLWNLAARGGTALTGTDGLFYGQVKGAAERVPEFPGVFADHFTDVQRFGLVSLAEACADAKLDVRADLRDAAVLSGRGSIDANVGGYRALADMDPDTVTPQQAMALYLGAELTASVSDVALVQSALTRTAGPCFTASAGCASSAVQLHMARLMIAAGEVDLAVVTGVDAFDLELVRNSRRLIDTLQGAGGAIELPTTLDGLMRPYDERAGTINFGEGAATLVLESREHALRRGAHAYGRIAGQALARDGLTHPLSSDDSGTGLVTAVRRALGTRPLPAYVHGGSDGDPLVTAFEAAAVRTLYGDRRPVLTSHEGSFGHNGASAGAIGVGLTLLMMERGEVCPTANCEQPADLPFDPVPGTRTRPMEIERALVLSYQIGGVKSVTVVEGRVG